MACTDVENGRGHGADEMNIVANKDEGALVLAEGTDEGIDRADVQVGGGFVHQKEIRWIEEDFDESETRFFSSAEDADGFKNIVTTEEKRAKNSSGGLFADGIGGIEHGFEHFVFHVKGVAAVLGKVANAYVMPCGSFSLLDGKGSPEKFEESRFACAVGTDENGALAAFGFKVEASVDDEVALAFDVAVGVVDIL